MMMKQRENLKRKGAPNHLHLGREAVPEYLATSKVTKTNHKFLLKNNWINLGIKKRAVPFVWTRSMRNYTNTKKN